MTTRFCRRGRISATQYAGALFAVFLLLAAPLRAEDKAGADKAAPAEAAKAAPQIHLQMDPALAKRNSAYEEALKKLDAAQQQKLKDLDDEYMQIIELDLQLAHVVLETRHCTAKPGTDMAADANKYKSELGVYANSLQARSNAARDSHRAKRIKEAPFIDAATLDDHYAFMTGMTVGLGVQLAKLSFDQGGFEKTDCGIVQKKLDTAFDAASRAASGAPAENDPAVAARIAEMKQAAEKGDNDARASLGMMYMVGKGVEKDPAKGLDMLTKAAEAGYERAQFLLGLTLGSDVTGQPPDREKAKYWLEKSAAQGNKKAVAMLQNFDRMKPPEPVDALRQKIAKGDADAAYELGGRYANGMGGVDQNRAEALRLTLMAAGKGHPLAQSDVAVMLINAGRNDEGISFMMKAANAGIANSQLMLATIYYAGELLPKNDEQAIFWAKKAADAGDSRAVRLLEKMHAGDTPPQLNP